MVQKLVCQKGEVTGSRIYKEILVVAGLFLNSLRRKLSYQSSTIGTASLRVSVIIHVRYVTTIIELLF